MRPGPRRGVVSVDRGAIVLALFALLAVLTLATFVAGPIFARRAAARLAEARAEAQRLGATDLALTTEARYTRHPTQADAMAPFLDHPGALEHFPSGALVLPRPADE
ncbi:hypothetical protein L6R52_27080 [Myxococcota bacterium]|nr:hypothetical protein [Myxococcota bacterium]